MQLKIWKKYGCKLSSQTFECHWCQSKKFNHLATINRTNIFFPPKKICHGCQCLCNTAQWANRGIRKIGGSKPKIVKTPKFSKIHHIGVLLPLESSLYVIRVENSEGLKLRGQEKNSPIGSKNAWQENLYKSG